MIGQLLLENKQQWVLRYPAGVYFEMMNCWLYIVLLLYDYLLLGLGFVAKNIIWIIFQWNH